MAIYSTIGKWLVASTATAAGVAGTVIGVSKVSWLKVDVATNYSSPQDKRNVTSNLNSQQDSSPAPQFKQKEILSESEKDLGDQVKNSEDSNPTLEQNQKTQSEDLKGEEIKADLKESPAKNTSDEIERVTTGGGASSPTISVKHENQLNSVNWFSVKLGKEDIFDENEWPVRECYSDIKEDKAIFRCNLNDEPSKPITFNLFLSSSPTLKGKVWKDLIDLHLKPDGEDKAVLGLIFANDNEREIEVPLVKKELTY